MGRLSLSALIAALKTGAKVVATAAFHLVGFAFVGIAGAINYKASAGQGEFWAYAAIATTVLTAALLVVSTLLFTRRNYAAGVLMIVLALPFLAQNWLTASGNVASADKGIEDARTAHDRTVTSLADRRKDAEDRRDAAKTAKAGETEASALAKIEKIKAEHSPQWNYSNHCDPAEIHLPITKQVCGEIAEFQAKAAAAKAYAKAVADIEAIDAQTWSTGTVAAQSTSAGAGATIKVFAAQIGHNITDKQGERFFEYQRGGGLELAAAIGPSVASLLAWLLFWSGDGKQAETSKRRASAPMSEPKPKGRAWLALVLSGMLPKRKESATVISFPAGSAREFHRRFFEQTDNPEDRIPAGDVQKGYATDCDRHGFKKIGSKTLSQDLQKLGVGHVKVSNRPYYTGVRWRETPLPATMPQGPRVVVDNTFHSAAPSFATSG